jgi:hypothetical protein
MRLADISELNELRKILSEDSDDLRMIVQDDTLKTQTVPDAIKLCP